MKEPAGKQWSLGPNRHGQIKEKRHGAVRGEMAGSVSVADLSA